MKYSFFSSRLIYSTVFLFLLAGHGLCRPAIVTSEETSASPECIDFLKERQLSYAQLCYENREYEKAAQEYKKFAAFFPDYEPMAEIKFMTAKCFYLAGNYREAVPVLSELTETFDLSDIAVKSYFLLCETHLKSGNMNEALSTLRNLDTLTEDRDIRDRIYHRSGWIFFESGQWNRAEEFWGRISAENRDKYNLAALSESIGNAEKIPRKSPALSGMFSIFPGGGYVYCERYRDGLTAFLVNAAVAVAAYEAFDNDLYALGGILGLAGAGFYGGSIYGGVSSARKYNRRQTRIYIDSVKKNMDISVSGDMVNRDVRLTLNWNF